MSDARLWAELLRWYVEMGVDEAIAEIPNDRTRPGPVREPVKAQAGRAGTPPTAAPRPLPDAIVAPGAAALARAATTLAELARAVAAFEGCALRQTATTTVFADGNPAARLMLICAA